MRLARPSASCLPWPDHHARPRHATIRRNRSTSASAAAPAITAVVDDFVGNVAKDNRINKFFANTDIPRLKRLLVQQICAGSGGPCKYEGRSMREAHRGIDVAQPGLRRAGRRTS